MSDRVAIGALPATQGRAAAVAVYGTGIVAAEALAAFVGPVPAAGLHGVLLVVLLTHHLLAEEHRGHVFAALALVPLLRLSSLALATDDALELYLVSGVPVLFAAVLAADALALPRAVAVWEIRQRSQWHAALAGLAVAAVAAPLLGFDSATDDLSDATLLLAVPIVFVFAGVLEELLFRGIVQGALAPLMGGWSVAAADLLFAATYLGCGSVGYAAFMASFGAVCGWWVRRTRSVAGATIAHGLLAALLLVLWPALR